YVGCRIPGTGSIDTAEVLGVDFDSGTKLRLDLPRGDLAALMRPDGHVLLGDGDRAKLGIEKTGGHGMENNGLRAVPVGVRTGGVPAPWDSGRGSASAQLRHSC